MTHELKILPEYLSAILRGDKTFEVRKNDRNYKVGDFLFLREYYKERYTGAEYVCRVTYILTDPAYCKEDFVIMGIKLLK